MFVSRPVRIEAMRWDGTRACYEQMREWAGCEELEPCALRPERRQHQGCTVLLVRTRDGTTLTAAPDDMVIRFSDGSFSVVAAGQFDAAWQQVG
jgi:hypothetical protein